jgi:ketosteroid isomerase-like protein
MSREDDLRLIESAYRLWGARDFDGLLALVDPEVVWVPPVYALEPGPLRGHDAVRRGIDAYFEVFERFEPRAEEILDTPEPGRYLVMARTETRGRESGVETTIEVGHLLTIRDGRFTRVEIVTDRQEARERAGLDRP